LADKLLGVRPSACRHESPLRRFFALPARLFCAAHGLIEVLLGRLDIVFEAHLGIVPQPFRDVVHRESFEQLGLPTGEQIVE
jgi:hypothetical protein